MENLANTKETEISTIEILAAQARALKMTINVNMWQLARVFVEAKQIVPHGQWGKWLEENAEVSERTAQDMMQAYKRFGGIPQIEGIGKAKLFRMLPLPDGAVEQFLKENDVSNMSTREIERAVKQARAEADEEIQKERRARMEAEQRAAAAEKAKNQPSAELRSELHNNQTRIAQQEAEIERLAKAGSIAAGEAERLRRELKEQTELLEEQQAEINRAQQELLNMQSAAAKGDAERTPESQLTLEAFSSAVRVFIGTCARLPMMRFAFAAMGPDDLREYRVLLETVEKWAKDSREAMDLDVIDGGINDV